jgi:hypothetical protein
MTLARIEKDLAAHPDWPMPTRLTIYQDEIPEFRALLALRSRLEKLAEEIVIRPSGFYLLGNDPNRPVEPEWPISEIIEDIARRLREVMERK